jgi:hypothetical protein
MLVNDLDLEVQAPSGELLLGNATAALSAGCRDSVTGADRCDNVESVEISAPEAGIYLVRVRGAAIPQGPQPFALVARAESIADETLGVPALQPIASGADQALALSWSPVDGAAFYEAQESASSDFATILRTFTTTSRELAIVEDVGTYWFRVRACLPSICGAVSNVRSATVTSPPKRLFVPLAWN